MAHVELRNVRKTYPGSTAEVIKGVDVSVGDGEFLVLLGPSGCGKSTLLRMVAGLESISSGEAVINGRIVNELEPKDRNIAMVFQNYALYPHMSVFDNMAYGLKVAGLPKAEIAARVGEAAEMLELTPYLERKPRALSGGQRQRVAMGRAIVRKPAAFLFDEPLSNLDAKLRTSMRMQIKQLQRRLGVTSLYVTHDQVEAMTLADRIMILNQGQVEQIGTPMDVYSRPASLFVAAFIGAPGMNFMEGTVSSGGSAVTLRTGEVLGLGSGAVAPAEDGREVTLGIRPEHFALTPEGDGAHLTLTADYIEQLGADTLVHGKFGTGMLVVRVAGERSVAEGDKLALTATPEHLHLFDRESGRRIG